MHSLIRGSPKERYILLLSYYYMLKLKNLRIITRVKADDNNKFKLDKSNTAKSDHKYQMHDLGKTISVQ